MFGQMSRLSSGGVVEATNCLWPTESGPLEPGVGTIGMRCVCGVVRYDCAVVGPRTLASELSFFSRSSRKIMKAHTSTGGCILSKGTPMLFAASVMATLSPL